MNRTLLLKRISGIILLLTITISFLTENETILPSALVIGMLFLVKTRDPSPDPTGTDPIGRAAHHAIVVFSMLVAAVSFAISLSLPSLAAAFNLTGLYDGDFVRVTINDVHEFAYLTCILLCIECLFYYYHTHMKHNTRERSIIR